MPRKFSELRKDEKFELLCWIVAGLVLLGFLVIAFSA